MKLINIVLIATSVTAAVVNFDITSRDTEALVPRRRKGTTGSSDDNGNQNANSGNQGDNDSTNDTTTGSTLVLKEIGGVPGNECLTFRNNGEIVDAACVNDAADRQVTPSTIDGASALQVQRSFSAGFRADLVGVQACLGFNSTHFLASDCSDSSVELVSFTGGELRAVSGACASGHDGLAQITVDTTGQSCAQFESTAVTPTPP